MAEFLEFVFTEFKYPGGEVRVFVSETSCFLGNKNGFEICWARLDVSFLNTEKIVCLFVCLLACLLACLFVCLFVCFLACCLIWCFYGEVLGKCHNNNLVAIIYIYNRMFYRKYAMPLQGYRFVTRSSWNANSLRICCGCSVVEVPPCHWSVKQRNLRFIHLSIFFISHRSFVTVKLLSQWQTFVNSRAYNVILCNSNGQL